MLPAASRIYGDVGFPDEKAGKGTAYGVTGRAGFGAFGATAILSTFDPEGAGSSDVSLGATLNYRMFGGPLVPLSVTLQGGIGYSKPDNGLLPDDDDRAALSRRAGVRADHPQPGAGHPALDRAPGGRREAYPEAAFEHAKPTSAWAAGSSSTCSTASDCTRRTIGSSVDGGDPSVFGLGAHYAFGFPGCDRSEGALGILVLILSLCSWLRA